MTRRHGVVSSAGGLIPFGHLGWGYHDRADFYSRAAEYIADGLAQQQWVEYVGAGTREQLRAELEALPGIGDTTGITVTPALEFYGAPAGTEVIDPQVAVAVRTAAVEKAIARGYTGFRAISDATAVTRTPTQRDAFARFEFLIDQKMAVLPVSALCAYDISQLRSDADGLICLHPYVNHRAPTFRIYAQSDTGFALTGEIDAACGESFAATLQRIWPALGDGEVIVDASGLEFISHGQLLDLDDHARADGSSVVLRTRQHIPITLAKLLELTNVRIQGD